MSLIHFQKKNIQNDSLWLQHNVQLIAQRGCPSFSDINNSLGKFQKTSNKNKWIFPTQAEVFPLLQLFLNSTEDRRLKIHLTATRADTPPHD